MANEKPQVCAVVGVGPGNGEALARRFAADGYAVALMARPAGSDGEARRRAAAGQGIRLRRGRRGLGDGGVRGGARRSRRRRRRSSSTPARASGELSRTCRAEDFERSWRVNALGLFLVRQAGHPGDARQGQGAIVVVGATASRRGVAGTAAFAPAKMAQKGLAESMARHLGPAGIHVALIVVDGVVRSPAAQARFPDRPADAFIAPPRSPTSRRTSCGRTAPPGASRSRRGPTRRSGEPLRRRRQAVQQLGERPDLDIRRAGQALAPLAIAVAPDDAHAEVGRRAGVPAVGGLERDRAAPAGRAYRARTGRPADAS